MELRCNRSVLAVAEIMGLTGAGSVPYWAPCSQNVRIIPSKRVYSKKRVNPASCQPSTAPSMVQMSKQSKSKQVTGSLLSFTVPPSALPLCFLSHQWGKTKVVLQKFAGLGAVCLMFSRELPLWGEVISFLFSRLATILSSALLMGWSVSAGKCFYERGGFAEGCADVCVTPSLNWK